MEKNIPYKIYLEENEMPKQWYNVRADMKKKPAPILNPETLMIKTEQQIQTDEGTERTYHLRERRLGSMQRNIHLPAPAKAEGAKASFKHGVMEITLQ